MWLYHKFGGDQAPLDDEWRTLRLRIAQWYPGWTLEYIDNLKWVDVQTILALRAVDIKLEKERAEKAKRKRR